MSKFLPESMHRLNVPGMEDSFVYTTATMGVHQLLKIPANKGLSTALGFAYDLVRSSVITTTVDLAAGKEEARTHIERPTDDEIARFVTLAETNPGFIEDAYWANLAAARVLGEPDGSAAKLTDAYKAKILDANQTDLNPARRDLADDLAPFIYEAIAHVMPGTDMTVTAANMARWEPGPGIKAHHFGAPPSA